MLMLLILAFIGVLVYAISNNSKIAELGRLMFACALLVICFELAHGISAIQQLQRLGR